jgi:uncharacterized protein
MDILVTALAALIIGLGKGGIAGIGALVTPLLAMSMSTSTAIGNTLPLLIIADMFALRTYWGKWDKRQVWLLLPAAVVGILLGTTVLVSLQEHDAILRKMLGLITLGLLVYKFTSDRLARVQYVPHPWHGYLAGAATGFMSALAHQGGPPYISYMVLQKLKPVAFAGTTTLFFASVNLIKLPGFLLTGVLNMQRLVSIAWALPLIPLGVWLGKQFINWVSPEVFEVVLVIAMFGLAMILLFYNGGTA